MNYRYLADRTFRSSARWISRPQRASSAETANKLQTGQRVRRGSRAPAFSQPPAEGLMWFPGKRFRCGEDGCDKEFRTMRGLAYHWRSHNKPLRYYRCKRCGFRSPDKVLADVHRAVFHKHPRRHRNDIGTSSTCARVWSSSGHPDRSASKKSAEDTSCSDPDYNVGNIVHVTVCEDMNNNTENNTSKVPCSVH
ncbi:hypothetical protein Bbelb_435080 [Branchiostoma belcheri]|nr:hypothetical protein Bbelb_435080 [Branchiostoma belcheri]